jgi:hypothetical protein
LGDKLGVQAPVNGVGQSFTQLVRQFGPVVRAEYLMVRDSLGATGKTTSEWFDFSGHSPVYRVRGSVAGTIDCTTLGESYLEPQLHVRAIHHAVSKNGLARVRAGQFIDNAGESNLIRRRTVKLLSPGCALLDP